MRIAREFWFFDDLERYTRRIKDVTGRIACSECEKLLEHWYSELIYQLKDLIPEDFRHICCVCLLKESLDIKQGMCCEDCHVLLDDTNNPLKFVCDNCGNVLFSLSFKKAYFLMQQEILKSWGEL